MAPGIYCLKLLHTLDTGKYALGDLSGQELQLRFWDFGVFERPTIRKPAAPKQHAQPDEPSGANGIPEQH